MMKLYASDVDRVHQEPKAPSLLQSGRDRKIFFLQACHVMIHMPDE
jgi:hypothetical protein